jgi:alanine-synthesizing transaminase
VEPGRRASFGEHGEGFVRISLVENTHRVRQAVRDIRAFLRGRSCYQKPLLEFTDPRC